MASPYNLTVSYFQILVISHQVRWGEYCGVTNILEKGANCRWRRRLPISFRKLAMIFTLLGVFILTNHEQLDITWWSSDFTEAVYIQDDFRARWPFSWIFGSENPPSFQEQNIEKHRKSHMSKLFIRFLGSGDFKTSKNNIQTPMKIAGSFGSLMELCKLRLIFCFFLPRRSSSHGHQLISDLKTCGPKATAKTSEKTN